MFRQEQNIGRNKTHISQRAVGKQYLLIEHHGKYTAHQIQFHIFFKYAVPDGTA